VTGASDSVGLCRTCAHVQVVTSARESVFYLCRLSASDPRFPKYPALPVRACDGYAQTQNSKLKNQKET
jgi:hypothetical protein